MNEKDLAKAVSDTLLEKVLDAGADLPQPPGKVSNGRIIDPSLIDERLVVHHKPSSMESEYFRFLRTRIEYLFQEESPGPGGRIILVTGASLGAGKTFCTINLALTFARAYGSRTLFLDADSRNSVCERYFGLGRKHLPGFSDVLTMKRRAGSVLVNTGLSDLIYFPSGEFSDKYIDRLRGSELGILMNNLRTRFQYILIDAPPAFPMPEPSILAPYCDGVLIVLGAGRDGPDQLEQAMESLDGRRIMGVILNGVKTPPGQRYGAYGYYGRKAP